MNLIYLQNKTIKLKKKKEEEEERKIAFCPGKTHAVPVGNEQKKVIFAT